MTSTTRPTIILKTPSPCGLSVNPPADAHTAPLNTDNAAKIIIEIRSMVDNSPYLI